jgi:hypothetical protein
MRPMHAIGKGYGLEKIEVTMFARVVSDGRVLGFSIGDWSMLLGGFALIGLLILMV